MKQLLLMSSQVLAIVVSRNSQCAGEFELGNVVAVQARDVLVVGACQRLLRLNDLNAVGHAGEETFSRSREVFVRQIDVFMSDRNLLFCRVDIQERGTNVIVNLTANILGLRFPLSESRLGLRDVALDAT